MTCPHCARMKAEIERLRDGLGILNDLEETALALREHFAITATGANILAQLYAGGGRPVQYWALEQHMKFAQDARTLKAHVWFLRNAVGPDFIETVREVGYRLTPVGRARCYQALRRREAA